MAIGAPLINSQNPLSVTENNDGTCSLNIEISAVIPNAGLATSALQVSGNNSLASIDVKTPSLGQAPASASVPVVLASNQIPLSVSAIGSVSVNNFPTVQAVSGSVGRTWTAASGTDSITAFQGGAWNINNFPSTQAVSGSISVINTVAVSGSIAVNNFPSGQKVSASSIPVVIASDQSSIKVTLQGTNASSVVNPIRIDENNEIVVSPGYGPGADRRSGMISTTATTKVAVYETPYTEQTTNAQRSISSTNFFDGSFFGTGNIKLTYLDQTGAGPFTETILLAGTAAVNTASTSICYIEKIEVVGSSTVTGGGGIFGTVSLFAATGGTGATIATISGAQLGITSWAQHYVPTGKTCKITTVAISNSGNAAGDGATFTLQAKAISGTNVFEPRIAGDLWIEGTQTGTRQRKYESPIVVAGPSRILAYVTPFNGNTVTQRIAFDYVDY